MSDWADGVDASLVRPQDRTGGRCCCGRAAPANKHRSLAAPSLRPPQIFQGCRRVGFYDSPVKDPAPPNIKMLGVIVPQMRTRSQSALSPTHQNSGGKKRRLPAAALEAVALGGNSKKEDACQPRPWRAGEGARSCTSLNLHALGPDLLAEVFSHLPFEDRLRSVPLVSKEWRSVSRDPVCWRRVDMEGWFEAKVKDDYWWEFDCEGQVEFLIKKIVDRSCGQLRELRTMHCSDEAIAYIAERCPFLTVLSVRNSPLVTDRSAAKLAASCPEIQELDVSDCYNISNQALDELRRWKPCKLKIKPLVLYFFWQHMLRIYMSSCKSPSQT